MNLQEDRFCRGDEVSEVPIFGIADIPFFRCPQIVSSETKFLFGKILAVQQGMVRPPKSTIFWLGAVREIGSAMAIAASEAKRRAKAGK